MFVIIFAAAYAASTAPHRATDTEALRALDRAMVDSYASGDRSIWKRALAPDALLVDENGVVLRRDAFIEQIAPLPQGTSGHIAFLKYDVTYHGNAALVVHTDDERENYHGQRLEAKYLTSETWFRESGAWKLALLHVYVIDNDPPAIALPSRALDEYAGTYEAASDLQYRIARSGSGLIGGVVGHKSHPLKVEIRDVLFAPGQPRVRLIFQRDAAEKVTGYLSRREGQDVIWTRLRR